MRRKMVPVLWDSETLCMLYIKELKQRKNMNVAPKSLSNEFKSNCVKRERILVFYRNLSIWSISRKMVTIMWDLGKASHEHPTFLHSWFWHSSISQWLIIEIFDNRSKGGLKLHPKHIENHDRFLKMATLQTCQIT
jgi:hypothetical protein